MIGYLYCCLWYNYTIRYNQLFLLYKDFSLLPFFQEEGVLKHYKQNRYKTLFSRHLALFSLSRNSLFKLLIRL